MSDEAIQSASRPLAVELLRLARPKQWAKSVFVVVGPAYGWLSHDRPWPASTTLAEIAIPALVAAASFSLLSSGLYVFNDIFDAERDRAHPRKRRRPIASGAVPVRLAWWFAGALMLGSLVLLGALEGGTRWAVAAVLGLYAANVVAYTLVLKRLVIGDVMGLSMGFVLRVIGGCAAVGIWPSTWLLNCTFFLAMFLSFGKRLGERATMGDDVASVRQVQAAYTSDLLRMALVVTAVAALVTYSLYVQAHEVPRPGEFNLLWLTMLPATYGLLRCIVLLERGEYDDPTELAAGDRPFQVGLAAFGILTAVALWGSVGLGGGGT